MKAGHPADLACYASLIGFNPRWLKAPKGDEHAKSSSSSGY